MRLKLNLQHFKNSFITLPSDYNEIIQGFIYQHLDSFLAKKIHDEGFKDPETKRKFKLFTFSRLIPEHRAYVNESKITFYGNINLIVASPIGEFIQSFAKNLTKAGELRLLQQPLIINSVKIEGLPEYRQRILVKTLSPITVYSTLSSADKRKKTYYYSPFEQEFEKLIIENLNKKLRVLTGKKASEGSVKPYRVSSRDQRIVIYKNTVVKGWDGVFELQLPPELFTIAFDAGLGAKNSQGFGCIEIWKQNS